jgi:trimeric autotransporter adhesin
MAIVPIEILKTKFESGDFPRSTDYQDLIDTLASASGALSDTDGLSEGSTNKYFTDERAQDAIATALAAGTHTNITVGYNDASNAISLTGAVTYTDENAQDAIGNALGTGLSYNDSTGAISVTTNTYDAYGSASTVAGNLSTHESDTTTHGTTGNIVGTSDTQTLTNKTLTSPKINEDVALTATATELNILDGATLSVTELNYVDGVTSSIQTQINNKAPLADPTFTGTVSGVTKTHVGLGNVDDTSDANKPVSTATQTALDLKANLSGPTFTGTVTSTNNLVVDGDFTVNGTNFAASATSITIEDNMLQLAHQNAANTVDLGLVVGYNDGSAKHAGIVRDVSDNKWKLFKGVGTEPINNS